ncbi:rho guanine nucleotide exchange factor 19-like isoform X1 [Polypterus senegalus]|uniref:rho guanine nucleotide exchange factor 19-like isoform X1 n=2 Tax=Polypterus senegalus TaxID=55291 RepID=UPI0019630CAF|nr:rho guanine nucleotide exchange factor 19-like isoform X1 [Polypterus senegalus]
MGGEPEYPELKLPCTLPCSAPTIMDMFCKKQTFSDSPSKHQASCEKSKVQGESKHGLPSFFRVKKSRASDEHKKSASLEDLAGRRPRGKNGLHPAEARYGVDGLQKPIFMCTSAIVSDWLIVESSSAADKPFSVSQGREANECLRDGPARTSGTDKRSLGNVHNNLEKRKRRESKYIHSSPLYQDYWLTYVKEDIKKHSSNTSHLTTMLSMAGLLSTSLIGSTPSLKETNFSCWQDLPEVKSRGLLEGLTPQQRRLQEAMFEVITSEASYFKSLTVAVNHFVKSQELSQSLCSMERHTLFSNLLEVHDVSERFLLDLEERLEESVILTDLSDLILKHSAAFRRVYIPYVTNQMYQDALVQRLLQENPKFAVALKMLEDQRVCQRQPLKSFLVLPFQRITRLKIVLENVLRLTDAESTTLESLKKAVAAISEIVCECNESVRRMKQTEELVLLEKSLEFFKVKSIPLITRGRWLVRQGGLLQVVIEESVASYRYRALKSVHLHLFNDLLLVSQKKEEGRFSVLDYTQPCQVKAMRLAGKPPGMPDKIFLLHLGRNHAGSAVDFFLKSESDSETEKWIMALSPLKAAVDSTH